MHPTSNTQRPAPGTQHPTLRLPVGVQRLLEVVGEEVRAERCEAYLVGGCVRDLLLGDANLDVDIVVEPDALALARRVALRTGGGVKAHERFGTARVTLPDGFKLDFATARTESYARPGALPEVVPSTVSDDLRRRDFTVNAMALSLHPDRFGELLDPFGGRLDLERRSLRVLHPLSFLEDPTRLFRAVRFEERLGLQLEPQSEALGREAVESGALDQVSPDRVRAGLYQILREPRVIGALLRLEALGVVHWLHPTLTLNRSLVEAVPAAAGWWRARVREPLQVRLVYLGAMLEPLGSEGAVRAAGEKLRVAAPDLAKLRSMLRALEGVAQLVPDGGPASAITRTLQPLSAEELLLLRAAGGQRGVLNERARAVLDQYLEKWRHTKLEATGSDLLSLGFRPGPALGLALRDTLDAKLDGKLAGREAELAHAADLLGSVAAEE